MSDQAFRLAKLLADNLHDLNILLLVMTTDVVDFTNTTLVDDQINGLAVIFHIQPVTDVQTLAVNRQRLVSQSISNHQRNQLLREVIRTIVVGATGNGHRQAVGTVVSQNQQVSGSLGATVRRAGVNRSFLGEEQIRTIQRQVTVNFIGRNLMITLDTVLAASIHQHTGTDNIGLEEDTRIFDGTVNMRFCRKVDHDVRMFFFKQFIHCFAVADICLHKAEIRVIHNRCQCGQIACIGQLVQTDDPVIRILLQHMEYKVTTNKPSAAGNNNIHDLFSSTLIYVSSLYNFFIKKYRTGLSDV